MSKKIILLLAVSLLFVGNAYAQSEECMSYYVRSVSSECQAAIDGPAVDLQICLQAAGDPNNPSGMLFDECFAIYFSDPDVAANCLPDAILLTQDGGPCPEAVPCGANIFVCMMGPTPANECMDQSTVCLEAIYGPVEPPPPPFITVEIDIKPGSEPNSFNQNERGVLPCAILGSETLDVYDIDTSSLLLQGLAVAVKGKKNHELVSYEDINGDLETDLLIKFADSDSWTTPGDDTAYLSGTLNDGTAIEGSDSIRLLE